MYQVLALDPSFSATGWAVVDKDEHKILKSGVFKIEQIPFKPRHLTTMKIYQQNFYFSELENLFNANPYIKEVYCEYPHGGQNHRAAHSFAVVTSIIIALCRSRDIKLEFCLESQAKVCLLGKAKGVTKDETRAAILAIYAKNGYIEDKAKFRAEAIADAMSVYTYFKQNKGL